MIQLLVCVKIMVVMIPINVLQVGTMIQTEPTSVLEMNGLLEPMPVKLAEISLEMLLSMLVVVLTLVLVIIMPMLLLMMDLVNISFQVVLISTLPTMFQKLLMMMDLVLIHQSSTQLLDVWKFKLTTITQMPPLLVNVSMTMNNVPLKELEILTTSSSVEDVIILEI